MRLSCAATALLLATTAGCGKRGAEPPAPTSPPPPSVQSAPDQAPKPEARPAFLDLSEREVPGRVFILAIDGASWDVFDRVLEAGIMPNLARVVAQGSRANLESMDPTASAILWTTIATGRKRAARHPVRTVDTYDAAPRVSAPVESAYDEGMKNRLKALGYIENAEEDDDE
ncbi:MAG: hypothetical protein FLDDKLPJ_01160 [Phycisphaerae bacterium]|nr:hypothetical protein [Phycisphaerae bacterium]